LPTLGQDCQSYFIHDFLEQLKTAPEEVYPAALRGIRLIEIRKEQSQACSGGVQLEANKFNFQIY
jgi:hypothetical protein